ncbi:hypothetical protein C8R45DRAFT_351281, partial [Mycena sanguinolenta]
GRLACHDTIASGHSLAWSSPAHPPHFPPRLALPVRRSAARFTRRTSLGPPRASPAASLCTSRAPQQLIHALSFCPVRPSTTVCRRLDAPPLCSRAAPRLWRSCPRFTRHLHFHIPAAYRGHRRLPPTYLHPGELLPRRCTAQVGHCASIAQSTVNGGELRRQRLAVRRGVHNGLRRDGNAGCRFELPVEAEIRENCREDPHGEITREAAIPTAERVQVK